MNIANRLAQVTLIAATFAAAFSFQDAQAAGNPQVRVIELPRVTIVAHREAIQAAQASEVRIVELPRVTVIAKRLAPSDTVVAQRAARGARV